jgi:hypothetical protein
MGWGSLVFGASLLLSPLLGGGGVILAANTIEPSVDVPPARLAETQKEFTDTSDLLPYRAQYQETMIKPIRSDRSRRAWIGTGIGFALNLWIIYALLWGY